MAATDGRPADPFWPAREALVRLRHARGMNQREAAERAGWAQSYQCYLERGKITQPSLATLAVWARVVRARVVVRVRGGAVEWWVTPDD